MVYKYICKCLLFAGETYVEYDEDLDYSCYWIKEDVQVTYNKLSNKIEEFGFTILDIEFEKYFESEGQYVVKCIVEHNELFTKPKDFFIEGLKTYSFCDENTSSIEFYIDKQI